MRKRIFMGMVMAGILLTAGQAWAEDAAAMDGERAIITEDDSLIIADTEGEAIFSGDVEPAQENGESDVFMTEDLAADAGLIEEEGQPEGSPFVPQATFEEGGEILLNDPMTVENEIIQSPPDEVFLRNRDLQAILYAWENHASVSKAVTDLIWAARVRNIIDYSTLEKQVQAAIGSSILIIYLVQIIRTAPFLH